VVEDVRRLSGGAVPVLVVSGEERSVVMKKALACGARDFLSKPFEPAEALLRIRNLLDVRMLHKASLADAETRYRAMVEGASDLICQIDPAGQITYANRAGVALLGVELAGRRFHDLVHRTTAPRCGASTASSSKRARRAPRTSFRWWWTGWSSGWSTRCSWTWWTGGCAGPAASRATSTRGAATRSSRTTWCRW
jgi:PAS domain-containing protein